MLPFLSYRDAAPVFEIQQRLYDVGQINVARIPVHQCHFGFSGTEGWEHVAVFIVCVLHDHSNTAEPCCALCVLSARNNVLCRRDE
jgi:hypothetical protein